LAAAPLPPSLSRSTKTNGGTPISETRTNSRWRNIKRLALLVLAVLVIGGVWMVYNGISTAIRAEHNLHSTLYVVRLVDEFVYEKNRWPQSWDELEKLKFTGDAYTPRNGELNALRIGGAMEFQWPDSSPTMRQRVRIDFDADLHEIAEQTPMTFEAIKPIGPYYEYRDYGIVDSLQQTVRQCLENQ
jgi:hypothetical protein